MKMFRKAMGVMAAAVMLVMAAGGTGMGDEMEFVGTVEQKGSLVVLFTPDDTYVIKGSDLLPDMIGRKVWVSGTVEQKDQVRVLTVHKFKEIVKEKASFRG